MAQWLKAANGDKDAYDRVMSLMNRDIKHEELALKKKELEMKEKQISGDTGENDIVKSWIDAVTADDEGDKNEQ